MTDGNASRSFAFQLNGNAVLVEEASPQTTLLDYVRSRGLTGAKEGCAEGECGACAVVLVKDRGGLCAYQAVNSCLMFLPMVAGQEVYTVESLASPGALHPVQQAMAEAGGSQCGYCTPGFVMSLFAEHYRPGRTGSCRVDALGGNLCRCTGYRPIRDAAASLGEAPSDQFRERLLSPAPVPRALSYRHDKGSFSRPASLAECLQILTQDSGSRIVAGNTDLGVESNLKHRSFPHLVSVEAIAELGIFTDSTEEVEIGAALSLDEVEHRWTSAPPVVGEWLSLFASPLIRNRATLGGNLSTASPIGDAAPLLLALDARVRIASLDGQRIVPLESFFTGYRKTVAQRDEVLVSIIVPKPYPDVAVFYKAAKRRLDDISTVAASFSLRFDNAGGVEAARFAFGGVAATPVRARHAESCIAGRGGIDAARRSLASSLTPMSDHRGSAAYRLALAQSLLEKFWMEKRP